jgi:sugar O-acyltransferase (sialic acid O-acetyltransferase NeuD family)
MPSSDTNLPLIVIGAGGHARVLLSTLLQLGRHVVGFTELEASEKVLLGIPCIGNDDAVLTYDPQRVLLVNGIGSVGSDSKRLRIYDSFVSRSYRFTSVIHSSACIVSDARIDEGVQIMAGAIIQTGCVVHENSIINTGAQLDHDCIIDVHAHVAPGAVLSGSVHVGARAHVGAGATVIQGVHIGAEAIVGAGAVVLSDVPPSCIVVGVPARPIRVKA